MKILEVQLGGRTIAVTPLRGLKRVAAFDQAMREERDAIEELERTKPGHGSMLGTPNLDKLLKLGAPDVVTDELLEEATLPEIFALLNAILAVNAPLEGRP